MISKSKIKFITSLRENKYRKLHHCFVAEGNKLVSDFLLNGNAIKEIFALKSWTEKYAEKFNNVNVVEVSEVEMKKISNLKNPSEVLAVVAMSDDGENDTPVLPDNWSLVLDGIRDPGNMGTIIRTAEWFGVENIFCSPDTVDVYNPKVVQATMGSLARVKIKYTNLEELLKNNNENITVYGTLLQGEDVKKIEANGKGAIVIGSEAHGISKQILPFIDKKITIIPALSSKAESLNAAIATAIICFALINT